MHPINYEFKDLCCKIPIYSGNIKQNQNSVFILPYTVTSNRRDNCDKYVFVFICVFTNVCLYTKWCWLWLCMENIALLYCGWLFLYRATVIPLYHIINLVKAIAQTCWERSYTIDLNMARIKLGNSSQLRICSLWKYVILVIF